MFSLSRRERAGVRGIEETSRPRCEKVRGSKRAAWLVAAVLTASLPANPLLAATPVSPPVVEYTLEANLDPKTHTIEGREGLIWRNPSGDPVSELQFHLYLNAFKNNRSIFIRESGGQLRGDKAGTKPDDWGWMELPFLPRQLRVLCRLRPLRRDPDRSRKLRRRRHREARLGDEEKRQGD